MSLESSATVCFRINGNFFSEVCCKVAQHPGKIIHVGITVSYKKNRYGILSGNQRNRHWKAKKCEENFFHYLAF
ncbi:hypothetical protein D3C80_1183420 [compost metagenome]